MMGPLEHLQFLSFSSGSCGNSYLFRSGERMILVDAAVSPRRMKNVLKQYGIDHKGISAVLLTHDHNDHVRNIGSICKTLCPPVFATPFVHDALSGHPLAAPYITGCRRDLPIGQWVEVAGFNVLSFEVPHDATQTLGYVIDDPATEHRVVIATDLGRVVQDLVRWARTANTLVIESNYDVDMLMGGSYTHDLKMRICKGNGHISNDECADALRRIYHPELRNIFLCHLSGNNNSPEIAYETSLYALRSLGLEDGSVALRTLPRGVPTQLFNL